MSDNGAAMTAAEITEGLARLGILHQTTLPYSPYQNAKQEAFWGPVEGRLMAMLEDVPDLTLAMLNEATQAWVEYEYNRKIHSETGEAPITRFLTGPEVTRPSPDSATLKLAFTRTERRTLRKSDGTVTIEGRRFEVPNRYRHLTRLELRFASWDLALVHLVDEHTGTVLCRLFPQDKAANASGLRRGMQPIAIETAKPSSPRAREITQAGMVVGTPYFMSPEQCDAKPVDARTDLYSLGATYYSLLTGRNPYEDSQSVIQVMFGHCQGDIPDPRAAREIGELYAAVGL